MTGSTSIPRSERVARWILAVSFVLLIVVLAGTFIKVPYAVERPGPVTDTLGSLDDGQQLVRVTGAKTYPTDGALYFTTVRVLGGPDRHISVWEWVAGKLSPDSRVVPEDELFPQDSTDEEIKQLNAAQMQGAQKNSIAVGMRSTGAKVPQVNLVASIAKGLPADGRLALKDEVRAVDGQRMQRVADIVAAISKRSPGEDVTLTVERGKKERRVTGRTTDLGGGRAGIGVGLEPRYDYPYEVRIDAGDVGGPSAGMMFALAVRDRLTPGAMTGGTKIAGTGTIDDSGVVGPIGGIAQKMVGAQASGAAWFLAPESNCDEVVGHVPDGLKVTAVGDFEEATQAVESIAKGSTSDLPTCEQALAG